MTFTGGINRPRSVWLRTEVRHPWGRLYVNSETVEIADANPFGPGHDPFVWKIADGIEFNRQTLWPSSWVGLRGATDLDWIWFRTQTLDKVSVALSEVGAREVTVARLGLMEIFPVRPLGSLAIAVLGALFVGFGIVLGDQADIAALTSWMRVLGFFGIGFGLVVGLLHVASKSISHYQQNPH